MEHYRHRTGDSPIAVTTIDRETNLVAYRAGKTVNLHRIYHILGKSPQEFFFVVLFYSLLLAALGGRLLRPQRNMALEFRHFPTWMSQEVSKWLVSGLYPQSTPFITR